MMQEQLPSLKVLHIYALVFCLLDFPVSVHGTPNINLPINAQVPPVARPNQAYNFVFSDSTFSWAGNSIDYSLANYSGWLHLDSSSRGFSGTPGSVDTGSFAVDLIATDESGSSSTSVTFVVSTDPGPGLGISIAEQLPAFGPVTTPDSLSLGPSSTLSLSFSPNTFTDTNANTVYYAICANNTPLPSWINFHPDSLTFAGTTPSSTSPWELPQAFGIQLIASNVLGFAEAVASFQLVIASHLLTFSNSVHVINITEGVLFNFLGLQQGLTLDDQPAKSSDIRQAAANTPPWMSFNSSDLTLSGTPPANEDSENFTITACDIYGDTASTVVLLQTMDNHTSYFTGPLLPANATIGTNFTYTFGSRLVLRSGANIAVNLGAASLWLNFDSSSLELQGYIPANVKPESVQVVVNISQGMQSQTQNLTIDIQNASNPIPSTAASHSTSPKTAPSSTTGPNQSKSSTSSAIGPERYWIAAAVIVPTFVAVGCLLLLCFCLKKRRRRKAEKDSSFTSRWTISRPIQAKNTSNVEVRAETLGVTATNEKRASSKASRASWLDVLGFQSTGRGSQAPNLRLSHDTIGSIEHAAGLDAGASLFLERADEEVVPVFSSLSQQRAPRKLRKTSLGINAPQPAVQRLSVIVDSSPTKRISRQKKRRSNLSYDTTSVFSSQRLSGIGHGRNTLSRSSSSAPFGSKGVGHGGGLISGPSGFGIVRNSWRNLSRSTWTSTDGSSDPGTERDAAVGKFQSNARPPMPNFLGKISHSHVIREVSDDEGVRKPTLRPVLSQTKGRVRRKSGSPSRSKSSLLKADPLQSFHKRRLQQWGSRNPLFSAGPSSSRLSTLHASKIPPLERTASPSEGTGHNNAVSSESPVTPERERTRRSYSESSSLGAPVRPSPSKSSGSPTSRRRQKSYIKYHLNTRALSPPRYDNNNNTNNRPSRMNSRGSSWVSTSSDSRFGSAASDAAAPPPPFHGFGEGLREETDEHGNKLWLREHPNPLGTHGLDVTDQELIDRLRVSGQISAAQRLSYLMRAQTEGKVADFAADFAGGGDGGSAESGDESRGGGDGGGGGGGVGQVKIGSTRGKRLGQSAGLKHGDPGNTSMRGDIGSTTAGGSAFL